MVGEKGDLQKPIDLAPLTQVFPFCYTYVGSQFNPVVLTDSGAQSIRQRTYSGFKREAEGVSWGSDRPHQSIFCTECTPMGPHNTWGTHWETEGVCRRGKREARKWEWKEEGEQGQKNKNGGDCGQKSDSYFDNGCCCPSVLSPRSLCGERGLCVCGVGEGRKTVPGNLGFLLLFCPLFIMSLEYRMSPSRQEEPQK